jgi:RNA polymerase sigma-70 factor (ECF subfamily)
VVQFDETPPPAAPVECWLEAAKNGSEQALSQVLEWCRPYLLAVAQDELETSLQAKLGASDLVQETFLEAYRDFGQFGGRTDADLRAWLRRILRHNLIDISRQYRETDKRQLSREISLNSAPTGAQPPELVDPSTSPSKQALAREQDDALNQALTQLPELYRQVVQWRNLERCSYEEIGRRLKRSPEAVRKLWAHAIDHLILQR